MTMSTEKNKALVRRYFDEVVNGRRLDLIDKLFAPDMAAGQNIRAPLVEFLGAFPDLEATVEEMIAEGNVVTVHWLDRGTHQGEWRGIPPTGREMSLRGISIFRLAGEVIVEAGGTADYVGMLRQLGVAPTRVQTLPPKAQAAYELATSLLADEDRDGIPDLFQRDLQVLGLETPEEKRWRLEEAKKMLDMGLITEEDYSATKEQILGELEER